MKRHKHTHSHTSKTFTGRRFVVIDFIDCDQFEIIATTTYLLDISLYNLREHRVYPLPSLKCDKGIAYIVSICIWCFGNRNTFQRRTFDMRISSNAFDLFDVCPCRPYIYAHGHHIISSSIELRKWHRRRRFFWSEPQCCDTKCPINSFFGWTHKTCASLHVLKIYIYAKCFLSVFRCNQKVNTIPPNMSI